MYILVLPDYEKEVRRIQRYKVQNLNLCSFILFCEKIAKRYQKERLRIILTKNLLDLRQQVAAYSYTYCFIEAMGLPDLVELDVIARNYCMDIEIKKDKVIFRISASLELPLFAVISKDKLKLLREVDFEKYNLSIDNCKELDNIILEAEEYLRKLF